MPAEAAQGGANGRIGGHTSTWLPQLAECFTKENDLDIHWVMFDQKAKKQTTRQVAGQTFHLLPMVKLSLGLALGYLPYRKSLHRIIKHIQPDIIHAWGTERVYPCVMRGAQCPTILSMQGVLSEYKRIGALPPIWQWRVMAYNEARWIRDADVVTSESEWGLDKVRTMAPKKETRMIEYGVHPSFYDIKWQPNPDNPVMLFCGSVDRRKGVDLLIQALESVEDREWTCKIAGSGPLLDALDARKIGHVEFLGNIPWRNLQKELAQAWCLVLPTLADTSPNVVKEARVVGMPVITTSTGGQAEYISHNENGLIVDPADTQAFAEAMDGLMKDLNKIMKMGATHLTRDREYFQPKHTAHAFIELYRELHYRHSTGT